MSVYESQTPAERRKRRRRRSEDLLQSWKTLSSFRGRTQSPHYIKVPEDVCVHILVQASSCGPIRVLLSVIWGHFVQASLGQTWDCLFRFKVSIRTGVYSKVWIMDLTKANVCVCVWVSFAVHVCTACFCGHSQQHCPHAAERTSGIQTHTFVHLSLRGLWLTGCFPGCFWVLFMEVIS